MTAKDCWVCGGPVQASRHGRKFCSDACRRKAWVLRRNGVEVLRARLGYWESSRPKRAPARLSAIETLGRWIAGLEGEAKQ